MSNGDEVKRALLAQLNSVMNEFRRFDSSAYDDFSGGTTTDDEIAQFNVRSMASIERIAGRDSVYYKEAVEARSSAGITNGIVAREMYGVVGALYHDVQGGYTQSVSEIVHANLFSDFLDMGDYLLSEGYKDPAAVIFGGILETHLKQLATKNGVDLMRHESGKSDTPKKAEVLNQELGKAAYNLLQQKTVTAWLDLRNKAAHAQYTEYDEGNVRQFSQGLKDFISKYPA